MAAANASTYDPVIREIWPNDEIVEETYDVNQTIYGLISKDTTFKEKVRHVPISYGMTGGASASFAAAKANKQPSVLAEFKITPVKYYSLFSIDRSTLERTKDNKAALVSALDREPKMAIQRWARSTGIYLAGDGTGVLAQGSAINSATITLANAKTIKFFEQGITCELSATADGTGIKFSQQPLRVASVDREAGTVTFTVPVTTAVPTAAATDYIYIAGDAGAVVTGVYGFVPTTAPGSTLFFGLDRSKDPQRLGGWRVKCGGLSPRASAMKMAAVLHENQGKPSHYFLSPSDYLSLQLELQSTSALKMIKEPGAKIGKHSYGEPFEGISFVGPAGEIKCFFDINVKDNNPLMLTLDDWVFASMNEVPHFDESDGNYILREGDADAHEGRLVSDHQLYTRAPGRSGIGLLATSS